MYYLLLQSQRINHVIKQHEATRAYFSLFDHEYRGSTFVRNVGEPLPHYAVSHVQENSILHRHGTRTSKPKQE
jgi:hypothetical protein